MPSTDLLLFLLHCCYTDLSHSWCLHTRCTWRYTRTYTEVWRLLLFSAPNPSLLLHIRSILTSLKLLEETIPCCLSTGVWCKILNYSGGWKNMGKWRWQKWHPHNRISPLSLTPGLLAFGVFVSPSHLFLQDPQISTCSPSTFCVSQFHLPIASTILPFCYLSQ